MVMLKVRPVVSRLGQLFRSRRLQAPPLLMKRRPSPARARWHQAARKFATATALSGGSAFAAALIRFGEVEPLTGRAHLAVLSHGEAREREEAEFAGFKEANAHRTLRHDHGDVVRVRRIALEMVRAAHHGLAIKQHYAARGWIPRLLRDRSLQWMDGLHWEVLVLRCESANACVFPGAGKILVYSGLLCKSDVEMADELAHEVGHVVARHSSGVVNLIYPLAEKFRFLMPLAMALRRSNELEAGEIGMLLLAAAGVDPVVAVLVENNSAKKTPEDTGMRKRLMASHPSRNRRCKFLSQPRVMGRALQLYSLVQSNAIGQ
ncbi:unnamed protein product [Alopecurus aequalis]